MPPTNEFLARFRLRVLRSQDATVRGIRRACITAGFVGLGLFVYAAFEKNKDDRREMFLTAVEHAASALMVAAFMGLTYEYYVHRILRKQAHNEVLEAVAKTSSTLPQSVFEIIADIAVRLPHTPTLFLPTREHMTEVLFLRNCHTLEQQLDLAAARKEEDVIWAHWFAEASDPRLKFLGSDIIGLLRRRAYADMLRRIAEPLLERWDRLPQEDKGWVLNYLWAASRCEDPMYGSLSRLLLETESEEIQRWILFVPQQMPHPELATMIKDYLRLRGDTASRETLDVALDSLLVLHTYSGSQRTTVRENAETFTAAGLQEKYIYTHYCPVISRRAATGCM